jgi:hypothetical protein
MLYIPGNDEDSILIKNKFIKSKVSHKNDTLAPKFPYFKTCLHFWYNIRLVLSEPGF